MEKILGLANLPHPGTTTRNELLKAQMCSGACRGPSQGFKPRLSDILKWESNLVLLGSYPFSSDK
jgi:hypothetical protein